MNGLVLFALTITFLGSSSGDIHFRHSLHYQYVTKLSHGFKPQQGLLRRMTFPTKFGTNDTHILGNILRDDCFTVLAPGAEIKSEDHEILLWEDQLALHEATQVHVSWGSCDFYAKPGPIILDKISFFFTSASNRNATADLYPNVHFCGNGQMVMPSWLRPNRTDQIATLTRCEEAQ